MVPEECTAIDDRGLLTSWRLSVSSQIYNNAGHGWTITDDISADGREQATYRGQGIRVTAELDCNDHLPRTHDLETGQIHTDSHS